MSDACMMIHKKLDTLPMFKFPFNKELLPENGIYFFYESGEHWGHGGSMQRVVHVDSHIDGRLADEIAAHFGKEFGKMHLTKSMHKALSSKRELGEKRFIEMMKEHLSFRFLVLDKKQGVAEMAGHMAAALSDCLYCTPSRDWVGNLSKDKKVRESGMWKVPAEKHTISKKDEAAFDKAFEATYKWLEKKGILAPVLKY